MLDRVPISSILAQDQVRKLSIKKDEKLKIKIVSGIELKEVANPKIYNKYGDKPPFGPVTPLTPWQIRPNSLILFSFPGGSRWK